jgi:signal transduction histidine kinase
VLRESSDGWQSVGTLRRRDLLPALNAVIRRARAAGELGALYDAVGQALVDLGIGIAIFRRDGPEPGFRLAKTTLPLRENAWERPLSLPALDQALVEERPVFFADPASAFLEAGERDSLWLGASEAMGVVCATADIGEGSRCAVCLAAPGLDEDDAAAVQAFAQQLGHLVTGLELEERLREIETRLAEREPLTVGRMGEGTGIKEVLRALFRSLLPSLRFDLASSLWCEAGRETLVLFSTRPLAEQTAEKIAADVAEEFVRFTGEAHRQCRRSPPDLEPLEGEEVSGEGWKGTPGSSLDAPLIVRGRITGLIRVSAKDKDAFSSEQARTFYAGASQASAALERLEGMAGAEKAALESLINSLDDGVILVEPDMRSAIANAAAGRFLAELAGRSPEEGAGLEETPLAEMVREVLETGESREQKEYALDGEGRRYLVAQATPLPPGGKGAVVVIRDATEERLMHERLLQSEKMASVGQLVSGVAHELNNPLTGVMGFAQMLLTRDLDEQARHEVETIYGEAERASKIVQNLLSFARRRKAHKEMVNLNTLVERVLELRSYDLSVRNVELELALDPKLPATMADPDQMQQVFLNIITNAEQAVRSDRGEGKLTVRSSAGRGQVRVSFKDDGPGISKETVRRIFDPFFTTKQAGEGTGLGLTIAYSIMEEHHGRIDVDSRAGHGATFTVELPIVQSDVAPEEREDELAAPLITGESKRILVVDDEKSILDLVERILTQDGHQVDVASRGDEALDYVSEREYDLIITDIRMPGIDGRELYRRVREMNRDLARTMVFITGDTVGVETRQFIQRVSNPVLVKPFKMRELREAVERALS